MSKPKPATPRVNLQVEMPATMVAALDLLASRANGGAGITRSHLVRAVLAEYIELKMGPDLRKAIAAWDKHGGDLMMEFMRTHMPRTPETPVSVDPMHDRNYNASPTDDGDILHKVSEQVFEKKKEMPQYTEKGGHTVGEKRVEMAESVDAEFGSNKELAPPKQTSDEFYDADPSRRFSPEPEHFPLQRTPFKPFD